MAAHCVWDSLTLPFSTLLMERALASSTPIPPVKPPMTRMESWLIGIMAVADLGVVSEAIFL